MEHNSFVPDNYNDGNRAFTQALMARGALTLLDGQRILANILSIEEGKRVEPEEVTQEDFELYISTASDVLSRLDYEIRSAVHQKRKVRVWAVVNTTSDPMTQLATQHTPDEIAFVKRVVDAMFESYNTRRMEVMALDEMQANKLRNPAPRPASINNNEDGGGMDGENEESQQPANHNIKGLKSSEAEALMRSLVEEGWFERSETGLYSLSPRALLELRQWLVDAYNDPDADAAHDWQRVKFCEACREIVTVGQRCGDRDCNARLHDVCEDAFWRTRPGRKCPRCALDWDGKHFVGERAVTETEAYRRGKGRGGARGRSSNLLESLMDEEGDDEV